MSLLDNFKDLGLIAQVSQEAELLEYLESGSRTVYCGFDPTANSLHIGNLVPLLALRRFQLAGHRPILLVGGATGMIGDPGGRDKERELQPKEVVVRQTESIRKQAARYLDFDCGDNSAIVVNNIDWMEGLSTLAFLRDVGKYFSINSMIQKESVRRRLEDIEQGISYTEFSYMVLQAYDYSVLNQKYSCSIQMGGSDQWGNITAGIDLIRRVSGNHAYAITYPLVTKSDGTKFGKSAGGSIWLDADITSPFMFYQFWRNSNDADVIVFLKIFTFLDKKAIYNLESLNDKDPGNRKAHTVLAQEMTRLVHGDEGLEAAERITMALFQNNLSDLGESDLEQLALDGMEMTRLKEIPLIDALVKCGLARTPKGEITRGQARKLMESKSVSVNGIKETDTERWLRGEQALFGKYFVIQRGKKKHHLVVLD